MAKPTAAGITLTRPSGIKEGLQTLLGRLFQPLGKLTSSGLLGPWSGVGGAGVDVVARLRPEDSTEEAAWRLVYQALEATIDDLATSARFSVTDVGDSLHVDHLLQLGGTPIDLDRIVVPWSFLKRPSDLPLLRDIADTLEPALVRLGVEPHAARATARRLDRRFGEVFYRKALDHRDRLEQLHALLESAPASALRQTLSWQAYGARLQGQLDEPLFGEPYSLRQLYVPLRGYRVEWGEHHGRETWIRHVVDLATAFESWLRAFDGQDALRVIAGEPGSGKSCFVKWGAADVMRWGAQGESPVPTILIPLHEMRSFDLESEVRRITALRGFSVSPLDIEAGERRLLLIFDGLDELDADHRRGREAASALVVAVTRLLYERNANGFQIQAILAGRSVIVQALQGELNRDHQIFQVIGYAPRDTEEDSEAESDFAWSDPDDLLRDDQRATWWRRWGQLTGETLDDVPAEIAKNESLASLADQPMLNHLIAITRASRPDALDASSSINSVYQSLLERVWERSWGNPNQQVPDLKPLRSDQFMKLFEGIGLAVWQFGGGRSTTLDHVANVARLEKLDKVLPVFRQGAEEGALALVTAFFFRRMGSEERFELTHKTFGEYLAARRLVRLVADLHRLLAAEDIDEAEGLGRWYRLTHAARMTPEILEFLTRELRDVCPLEEIKARRASLIRLFDANLVIGMPFQGVDGFGQPAHYRQAERFTAAAELALLCAIGACTRLIDEMTTDLAIEDRLNAVRWSPAWPDRSSELRTSAWDLLRRLEAEYESDGCVWRSMRGINLDSQVIRSYLGSMDLSCVEARWIDLSNASLIFANLSNADFGNAALINAQMVGVRLYDATLRGADATGADFSGASLTGCDLTEMDMSHCTLIGASLIGADLTNADLRGADLGGADFTGANLAGVALSNARIWETRGLTRAQLRAAKSVDWDAVPDDIPEE